MTFATFLVGFDKVGMRIAFFVLIAIFVVNLAIYGLIIFSIRWSAKRMAAIDSPIKYAFSPNGFRSSTERVTWESPWSRFIKIMETDSDILFFMERDDFVAVPKRFVPDQVVLMQLRRMISSNASGTVELLS